MKFTKTAFRSAFKANNQTLIWKLAFLKLGHTPTKSEVYELIMNEVDPKLKKDVAWAIAYTSYRKTRINEFNAIAWNNRGAHKPTTTPIQAIPYTHYTPYTCHIRISPHVPPYITYTHLHNSHYVPWLIIPWLPY